MWMELFKFAGIIVVWFVLMRFILPAFGVPTCMSGACQIKREEKEYKPNEESATYVNEKQ